MPGTLTTRLVFVGRSPESWRYRLQLPLIGLSTFGCHILGAQQPGDSAARLSNLARTHYEQGRPDSALRYYLAALQLRRAHGDHGGEARTLNEIAGVYDEVGERDSALYYYRVALPIARAVRDSADEAIALSRIGLAYANTGQRDSALYYYRAALPIVRAVGDRADEAITLNNIGLVYANTGQPDSALYYYRAALPDMRAVGDRAGEAVTLNNIGTVYNSIGQRDSALYYYRAALPNMRAVGDRAAEAATLGNIGGLYNNIGQRDSALYYFRAALPIRRTVGDRAGEARTLNNIGLVYRNIGQRDSALHYFRASLPIGRAVGDRAGETATLSNIAAVYLADLSNATNRARALAYFDSAAARSAGVRAQSGGDANAIAFAEIELGTFQGWAWTWIAVAARDTGAARDVAINSALAAAERGRAQGLRDLLMRSAVKPSFARPAALQRTGPTADIAKLGSVSGLAASDTVAGANLAAEAYQALAPLRQSRTSLLYYLDTGDWLTTWTLNPGGELRSLSRQALPADSIAALVTTLRRGVGADKARGGMARNGAGGDAEQESSVGLGRGVVDEARSAADVERAANALSAQLLPSNLLGDVPTGSELVVVPQGVLGLIPFAALTAPGDSIPLGIRYALRYSPSLRALSDAGRQPLVGSLQLIVGDPAMPTVTDASGASVRLRDLPAAKTEAAGIAQRFGAKLLTGELASETVVREQLPKARLVHLATHGLAFGNTARVRNSYVALAPDSQNDGLLTIGELLDDVPPLSTDLVVLSACQTGLGDLRQAEGTVGFQRAFLAKGARTILVSLWSVDDKATALLMDRFYTHWLGPDQKPAKSKAEALRLAQSDVRSTKGYESPKYWAAFQLVGAR